MNDCDVIKLSQQLIQRPSVTPNDMGCQLLIADILSGSGFEILHKRFEDVDNLFAEHGNSTKGKSLLFLGHTDVVASGNETQWEHPPFAGIINNNKLYGRGAADMKSAVAAFVCAAKRFVTEQPDHKGKLSIMLTSDEEGVAVNGIKKMMPHISKNHDFDYCLVGEPSSSEVLGDVARVGRRGSMHVELVIHGIQGHVAYPEKAENPVFNAAPFISDLSDYEWDSGNTDFPPTSFQISSVSTSTNVSNIIPGDLTINANFRFSPESSQNRLTQQLEKLLQSHKLKYTLNTNISGLPFQSHDKNYQSIIKNCVQQVTGNNIQFNTAGGTSDGRFIAPFGVDVVEFGLVNRTIHQINEYALVDDIINLEKVYYKIISSILS